MAVLIVEDSSNLPLLPNAPFLGASLLLHRSGSPAVVSVDSCSWLMDAGVLNILNHVGAIRCYLLESESWNEDLEHIWGCVPLMLMTLDPCSCGPWVALIAVYLKHWFSNSSTKCPSNTLPCSPLFELI